MAISKEKQAIAALIAHYLIVRDMDKNVRGFSGFLEAWKKGCAPSEKALIAYFEQEMKDAPKRLAAELKKEEGGAT